MKISKAFRGYVEIIDPKDPFVQLEASKSSIEDLHKDLFNEVKSLKYQTIVIFLLCKHKMNGNIEYSPVYFNSATKTVINSDKMILTNVFKKFYTE